MYTIKYGRFHPCLSGLIPDPQSRPKPRGLKKNFYFCRILLYIYIQVQRSGLKNSQLAAIRVHQAVSPNLVCRVFRVLINALDGVNRL